MLVSFKAKTFGARTFIPLFGQAPVAFVPITPLIQVTLRVIFTQVIRP